MPSLASVESEVAAKVLLVNKRENLRKLKCHFLCQLNHKLLQSAFSFSERERESSNIEMSSLMSVGSEVAVFGDEL